MADDAGDDKKNWLQWLNDGTSFIAAIIGILIAVQTIRLNNEIDRLNENIEASTLVSDLIGSLTAADIKQDIALLALDNALTSDPDEDEVTRTHRHKKLIAEIAASLLNNRTLSLAEGEDVIARSRQIQEEALTARKILRRLAAEPEGPEYQRIAQEALARYQNNLEVGLESPTARAKITYDDPEDSSPNDVVIEEEAVQGEAAITPQQTLELATTAEAVATIAEEEDSNQIIYMHYDNPELEAGMQALKAELEAQDWFVIENIELVSPQASNCAVTSDIRFFHKQDEDLANTLRDQVVSEPPPDLREAVATVRLIDLSNWSQANLVPKRQLELWVITKGSECRENRSAAKTTS